MRGDPLILRHASKGTSGTWVQTAKTFSRAPVTSDAYSGRALALRTIGHGNGQSWGR
jgi:hypothetical protein